MRARAAALPTPHAVIQLSYAPGKEMGIFPWELSQPC